VCRATRLNLIRIAIWLPPTTGRGYRRDLPRQFAHRPPARIAFLCREVFREICRIPVEDDGLIFSAETVSVEKIKEDQDYEGVRVKFLARLDNARVPIQVDVGFGDAVKPGLLDYPTLLPMSAPRIQAYPMETVASEKTEALVHLGMLNSRMKDFYDIWFLARTFPFDLRILGAALQATFDRRKTRLDSDGLRTLLVELSSDGTKRIQWRAFLWKSSLEVPDDFAIVNESIREFLIAPASAQRQTAGSWPPGGPW
jgi:hypothetical protein